MSKRFPITFPKVSDALNGIVAVKRHAAALHPDAFKNSSTHVKAVFALTVVCFFWGTTWIASRQGVMYMPALQMAGLRQTIGGTLYILFFIGKRTAWPKGWEWWPILILSLLNFILSNTLSTWGLKYISAGLGSIIGAIFPLWLVVIGLLETSQT